MTIRPNHEWSKCMNLSENQENSTFSRLKSWETIKNSWYGRYAREALGVGVRVCVCVGGVNSRSTPLEVIFDPPTMDWGKNYLRWLKCLVEVETICLTALT